MSYDREQRIRERAHSLWEAAGRPEGRDWEFWRWAEKLIAEETAHNIKDEPNMVEPPL